MQFINTSLAKLTKNLGNNHPITSQHFKNQDYSDGKILLICHKEIYPYEYIDSHDRFKETELPPIHEFHGVLSGKYHDLYLKTNVLSLADVWTKFWETSEIL
ncbi:7027_t:CDS:2 [Funneliformis geosporum]|uniref:7027_t:CDS:1 n=1 Tax=Funneliformis geosporum TaxID=1117311 RepID=A0A9W4X6B6_9GLOM|nr:7027_t:CDS:2 [Funneliformis geosporum]